MIFIIVKISTYKTLCTQFDLFAYKMCHWYKLFMQFSHSKSCILINNNWNYCFHDFLEMNNKIVKCAKNEFTRNPGCSGAKNSIINGKLLESQYLESRLVYVEISYGWLRGWQEPNSFVLDNRLRVGHIYVLLEAVKHLLRAVDQKDQIRFRSSLKIDSLFAGKSTPS